MLRNVFDQYSETENRLTHALFQTLRADEGLVVPFLRWAVGDPGLMEQRHQLSCQVLPSIHHVAAAEDQLLEEESAASRSIPDGWIIGETDGLAVVFEDKVTAGLSRDQLARHVSTAKRRGFSRIMMLVVTADGEMPSEIASWRPEGAQVFWKPWTSLYLWLVQRQEHNWWARELADFLTVLEYRLRERGIDVALTGFSGIPFGKDYPYDALAARAQLLNLMPLLRKNEKLRRVYSGILAEGKGRVGLETPVWDVLKVQETFNSSPHLSVVVGGDETQLQVTVPNADRTGAWKRLQNADGSTMEVPLQATWNNVRALQGEPALFLNLYQRHFLGMTRGVLDARIEVDLGTYFGQTEPDPQVKHLVRGNSIWLTSLLAMLGKTKKGNLELSLALRYRYDNPRARAALGDEGFVTEAVEALISLRPWYEFLEGSRE